MPELLPLHHREALVTTSSPPLGWNSTWAPSPWAPEVQVSDAEGGRSSRGSALTRKRKPGLRAWSVSRGIRTGCLRLSVLERSRPWQLSKRRHSKGRCVCHAVAQREALVQRISGRSAHESPLCSSSRRGIRSAISSIWAARLSAQAGRPSRVEPITPRPRAPNMADMISPTSIPFLK